MGQRENNLLHFSSENGVLRTSIVFDHGVHNFDNSMITLQTRLFNGTLPGPVFRLKPGDNFVIEFTNNLTDQGIPYINNEFSAPDDTNLHFHGLHISSEQPSDDFTIRIKPGESYSYSVTLPSYHMPGTHWFHPNSHGSALLQVGGGAAGAIIVEDPPSYLPEQVENATEILFFAQQFDLAKLQTIVSLSEDKFIDHILGDNSDQFVTVNGKLNPILHIDPGEWIRLRVIWAAWSLDKLLGILDLAIPDCEMQLLAKDGIYIRDFPRPIVEIAPILPGGRADIMVRCMDILHTYPINRGEIKIAEFQTSNSTVYSSTLDQWTVDYPKYLSDLRNTSATDGCSCMYKLTQGEINGRPYNENEVLHQSYKGAVVERSIDSERHPFHQQIYPFQLIDFEVYYQGLISKNYYSLGDWHDTVGGIGTIRYRPNDFVGKFMVHCHRLDHQDKGMMAIEEIQDVGNKICICGDILLPDWSTAVLISGVIFAGLASIIALFQLKRILKKISKRVPCMQ